MHLTYNQAIDIIKNSEILYHEKELNEQITCMAREISKNIKNELPVFLTVMNGGLFFAANLLKQISSPFFADYIHASRYGEATYGATHITWYRQPKPEDIRGRTIYILDDILDEGHTLAEIKRFLLDAGAKDCKIAVLINKDINKPKPITADFIGLTSPNQFLFGYGMDIYGLYRQLPDIYVYKT